MDNKELLQQLWNEFSSLICIVDDYCDDHDHDSQLEKLHNAILDTEESKILREKLKNAGVVVD